MAATRGCGPRSPLWACATSRGSAPTPQCGRRARLPGRPSLAPVVDDRQRRRRAGCGPPEAALAAGTAPADLGQDTRPQPAARGVANDYLARGNSGLALL